MLLVFLALAEGHVLGLARVPQKERNAEGGEGHNGKCELVQHLSRELSFVVFLGNDQTLTWIWWEDDCYLSSLFPSCIVAVTSHPSYLAWKREEHRTQKTQTYTTAFVCDVMSQSEFTNTSYNSLVSSQCSYSPLNPEFEIIVGLKIFQAMPEVKLLEANAPARSNRRKTKKTKLKTPRHPTTAAEKMAPKRILSKRLKMVKQKTQKKLTNLT